MGEKRYAHKILVGEPERKRRLGYLQVEFEFEGGDKEKVKIMMTIDLEKVKENKWRRTRKLGRSLMITGVEHSMKMKMQVEKRKRIKRKYIGQQGSV